MCLDVIDIMTRICYLDVIMQTEHTSTHARNNHALICDVPTNIIYILYCTMSSHHNKNNAQKHLVYSAVVEVVFGGVWVCGDIIRLIASNAHYFMIFLLIHDICVCV